MKKNYLYLIKSFMACALLCSAAYVQAQTKTKDLSKPQTQVKGYYTHRVNASNFSPFNI